MSWVLCFPQHTHWRRFAANNDLLLAFLFKILMARHLPLCLIYSYWCKCYFLYLCSLGGFLPLIGLLVQCFCVFTLFGLNWTVWNSSHKPLVLILLKITLKMMCVGIRFAMWLLISLMHMKIKLIVRNISAQKQLYKLLLRRCHVEISFTYPPSWCYSNESHLSVGHFHTADQAVCVLILGLPLMANYQGSQSSVSLLL